MASGNISKQVGGPIKADELKWNGTQKKDDGAAEALATALGGGVTKPTPVAFPWTIYNVTSAEDDDKPGIYCLAVFDVPKDTMGLKIKYCYVKADGTYGRVRWFPSYRLDDTERAAGRVEIQFGPLRPKKARDNYTRIDIVRLVAVKRAAKDVGNPPLTQDDRRGKGTTPAYTPPTLPVDPSGAWGDYSIPYANQIPGDSDPLTMGTILTGEYITGSPRILDVDPPKKEVDGVYYPVKIATTENVEDLMVSVRFGVYRVGTKAGGANTYSRRIPTPRHELTEEEREELSTNGFVWVDVGPLKANKKYHIKWIRARYSLDPDDSGAKVVRHRHPLPVFSGDVDLTQDYLPQDIVDGQTPGVQHSRDNVTSVDPLGALIDPVPGGDADDPPLTDPAGFLAVLAPTGDITDPPSNPDSSDIITNTPDLATEKDKDAIIVLRVWAAEGNRAKYAIDPLDPTMITWSEANVNRAAVVIKTLLPDGVTYKQRRHGIDIEDPDAVFVDITFHRQIGKGLVWVKNVSLNEADRSTSSTIDLAFTAGQTGDGSDIAGSFVLDVTGDADDNRQADATISWTNGTTPAIPKRIVILRAKTDPPGTAPATNAEKINGVPTVWKVVFKKNLKADSNELMTPSVGVSQKYTIPGVTMATGTRTYRAYLWIVGQEDPIAEAVDSDPGGSSDSDDMPIGDFTTYPTRLWIGRNSIVGDPAEGKAETTLRVYSESTGAGVATFGDQHIRRIGVLLFGISAWTGSSPPTGITVDSNDKHRITVDVLSTDTFVDINIPLKAGKWYCWYETYAINNTETLTMTTGDITSSFQAGVGGNTSTLDYLTGAYEFDNGALSTGLAVSVAAVDARHTDATITYTNPASRAAAGGSYIPSTAIAGDPDSTFANIGDRSLPVLQKRFFLEVKSGSDFSPATAGTGATRSEDANARREQADSLLDEASVYSALGAVSFKKRFKHRKNATIYVRAVMIPFGANRSSVRTAVSASTSLAVTDDNVAADTAAPSGLGTPTARYRSGNLRFKVTRPTADINTLREYEWMISNDSSFGSGSGQRYLIEDAAEVTTTTTQSTIKTTSNKLAIPISRSDLAVMTQFSGATSTRPTLYYKVRVTNSIGSSGYVSGAAPLILGRSDSEINQHGAVGRNNMVEGGAFMSNRNNFTLNDPQDQPGRNWKWNLSTSMQNNGFRIRCDTNVGSWPAGYSLVTGYRGTQQAETGLAAAPSENTDCKYDQLNHQIQFRAGSSLPAALYGKIRRQLIVGEVYTLTFAMKASTTTNPGTLSVGFCGANNVYDTTTGKCSTAATITFTNGTSDPSLSTAYRVYKAKIVCSALPSTSAWLYFEFPASHSWSGGGIVYLDNVCLVRGNRAALYEVAGSEVNVDESNRITTFTNGVEVIGDAGGVGEDGITTTGYVDVIA